MSEQFKFETTPSTISIAALEPELTDELFSIHVEGEQVLLIRLNGEIVISPNFTAKESAKEFWKYVEQLNPYKTGGTKKINKSSKTGRIVSKKFAAENKDSTYETEVKTGK
jgi:hypothetical protein